jgi:KDO2-lipid IV(A) lauroyltransferase
MSKPRSNLADFVVFLIIRLVVCFCQCLSAETLRTWARVLAWLGYHLDRRHREVAMDNLRQAFPDRYSERDRRRLVGSVYLHFCSVLMEILLLPRKLHAHTWRRHLHLAGGTILVDRLLSGRPLLLVTGHFGNWELAGYVLGLLGFPAYAVARPLDNPYLDDFLRTFRQRTGQRVLAKKGDFDNMQALLKNGGLLATLADQDAGQRGLFVEFFGRPASTHKAIALLALEYQVPLVVVGARRARDTMFYEAIVQEVILPESYPLRADGARSITQRFTTALEDLIRTRPEQYFWLHRRWKHQPRVGQKLAA